MMNCCHKIFVSRYSGDAKLKCGHGLAIAPLLQCRTPVLQDGLSYFGLFVSRSSSSCRSQESRLWYNGALQLVSLEQDLMSLPSPTPADVDHLLQTYHDKVDYFSLSGVCAAYLACATSRLSTCLLAWSAVLARGRIRSGARNYVEWIQARSYRINILGSQLSLSSINLVPV